MKKKILIIDDNQGDRQLIREYLTDAGFELEFSMAASGEEGVARLKEFLPHYAVIDTKLPGIDGYETCRQIKELVPETKVIILTGVVDAIDYGKARIVGADEFTIKTANYEVFTKSFREMLA